MAQADLVQQALQAPNNEQAREELTPRRCEAKTRPSVTSRSEVALREIIVLLHANAVPLRASSSLLVALGYGVSMEGAKDDKMSAP